MAMLSCGCPLSATRCAPSTHLAEKRPPTVRAVRDVARRPFTAPATGRSVAGPLKAAKTESGPRAPALEIQNLDTEYCNDFECTSSPAVEQTVRSFARDIQRLKYTTALFQPDVKYQDGFRWFTGYMKYRKLSWIRDLLEKPRTEVLKLEMLDNSTGTAQIEWVLMGTFKVFAVTIPMQSRITMNQVTGRIESHSEKWDLSGCSPPAAALLAASRLVWALKAGSSDAGDDISNTVASLSSFDSNEGGDVYSNPSDPTRFFQQQGNSSMNDMLSFLTVAAALYFVYKAYEAIDTLH